nr:hypothetical protein [Abalone asfa-like virus]
MYPFYEFRRILVFWLVADLKTNKELKLDDDFLIDHDGIICPIYYTQIYTRLFIVFNPHISYMWTILAFKNDVVNSVKIHDVMSLSPQYNNYPWQDYKRFSAPSVLAKSPFINMTIPDEYALPDPKFALLTKYNTNFTAPLVNPRLKM